MLLDPLSIKLDNLNYRTLPYIQPALEDQQDLIECLSVNVEFKMQEMVDSIIQNGWRSIGTRPIVINEEGTHIVVEGNRRLAACQMILDDAKRIETIIFPTVIEQRVLDSLKEIEVDSAPDRDFLLPILADRHIKQAVKWSTQSKSLMCIDLFEKGKNVDEIHVIIQLSKDKVRNLIRGHMLIKYCISLPSWSSEERGKFSKGSLPVDRLLRLFGTSGASSDFGLDFDDKFKPFSNKYPKSTFDKALTFLFKKAFVDETINTRTTWSDIYEQEDFSDLLNILELSPKPLITVEEEKDDEEPIPPIKTAETSAATRPTSGISGPTLPPPFMTALVCTMSKDDSEAQGIISLCGELRLLSLNKGYTRYPIASALLLRSLIEQLLKYHLKHTLNGSKSYWDKLVNGKKGYDPTLGAILGFIEKQVNNGDNVIFKTKAFAQLYNVALGTTSVNKTTLDMIVHHSDVIRMKAEGLDALTSQGVLGFINEVLKLYNI